VTHARGPRRTARYKQVEEQGLRFVFKYDDDAPDLLHIYVRHVTTIDDALDTFFEGATEWNAAHERFETYTATHGMFWFWLEENAAVMIISCFRL
jgi:hypothetical protein